MIAARLADATSARRALLVTFSASCSAPCKHAKDVVATFLNDRGEAAPLRMDVDIDRCVQDVGVCSVPTFQWYAPERRPHTPPTHVGLQGLRAWLDAQASTSRSTSATPTNTHTMPR